MAAYAVYPYIPTSNRNEDESVIKSIMAVYPYIPTSNRNPGDDTAAPGSLYILIFLHQTATARR